MVKYRWVVEFDWEQDEDFENDEDHVTTLENDGITYWRYHVPTILLPWKVIKKEKINGSHH